MSGAFEVVLLSLVLLAAAVLLPLIPAIVTYKLFPDQTIGLKGPLQGLTVRATGAFAGYVIVFILSAYFTTTAFDALGTQLRPAWIVEGTMEARRASGELETSQRIIDKADVILQPKMYNVGNGKFRISVVGDLADWPLITISIPDWGSTNIDVLRLGSSVEIDDFGKRISIMEPIVVRQNIASLRPYGAGEYLNPAPTPRD